MTSLNETGDALSMRRAAARRYQPEAVEILFVAEAPPCGGDRYFYFEDVQKHDSLWAELTKALYGNAFGETRLERKKKHEWLNRFREDGYYLVDAVETPEVSPALIRANTGRLIKVIKDIKPKKIILIKATVYENLYKPLRQSGLPVVNERIPFPGSGQQRKFREKMRQALEAI